MRIAVFAPLYNRTGINPRTDLPYADATGAFQPEGRAFVRHHGDGARLHLFDSSATPRERQVQVTRVLDDYVDLDAVAFFCHGHKLGLQAGFDGAIGAEQLAQAIGTHRSIRTVVLYACDTGRDADNARNDDLQEGPGGDGGFADLLRDDLVGTWARQATVFGHPQTGHTDQLPYVRRFGPTTHLGGEWIISPRDALWARWRRALHDADDSLRFDYPFLTQEQIRSRLSR